MAAKKKETAKQREDRIQKERKSEADKLAHHVAPLSAGDELKPDKK